MLIRWQGPGQGVTDNGTNVYFHNDLEFTSGAFTGITGGDISTVNAFTYRFFVLEYHREFNNS